MQLFGWIWVSKVKLHPLYTGLDLVDFEIFFKAWITKYSLKYGYMY